MRNRSASPRRAIIDAPSTSRTAAIMAWLSRKAEQHRSRRRLALMSDAQLKDIGLTRDEPVPDIIRPLRD